MSVNVLMPVITHEGEDAVVTAWFVDEGGSCTEGQLLAEVQAEKVSDEVTAPGTGLVVDRVAINDPVHQGSPICRIVETAEQSPRVEPAPTAAPPRDPSTHVIASPAAKRVARELGVDLASVRGSGPGGRVTEDDVRAAATPAGETMVGLRAAIARNMRKSHAETAPVTLFSTATLGASKPDRLTARIVKAVAEVLVSHPHLNGRRNGDSFEPADNAQISLAIQTSAGLVAPVVRNAASRSIEDVAADIALLAERAEAKGLTADDFEGGTFSVSNLGSYGIDGFTPIINLPQVAILGVGAARAVPTVADDGSVSVGYQLALSLTFDHAFVDGAPAAEFLRQVVNALGA